MTDEIIDVEPVDAQIIEPGSPMEEALKKAAEATSVAGEKAAEFAGVAGAKAAEYAGIASEKAVDAAEAAATATADAALEGIDKGVSFAENAAEAAGALYDSIEAAIGGSLSEKATEAASKANEVADIAGEAFKKTADVLDLDEKAQAVREGVQSMLDKTDLDEKAADFARKAGSVIGEAFEGLAKKIEGKDE